MVPEKRVAHLITFLEEPAADLWVSATQNPTVLHETRHVRSIFETSSQIGFDKIQALFTSLHTSIISCLQRDRL